MRIAVFGTSVLPGFIPVLQKFFQHLREQQVEVFVYEPFLQLLHQVNGYKPAFSGTFRGNSDLPGEIRYVFSIGGDGTFLQSFEVIGHFDIPLIGINSGRLGFLADISGEQIIDGLTLILGGNYTTTERSLLEVHLQGEPDFPFSYALNETTLTKTDSSSMIIIHAWLNGEYLNSFWADGLIVATPTGSTAYSLSAGGPILTPDSQNFVITPIAPHNLTVRPIVVPDHLELLLKVEGRGNQFRTSLDSRSATVGLTTAVSIRKADFKLKTLHLPGQNFFSTIRTKLMWGADKRN